MIVIYPDTTLEGAWLKMVSDILKYLNRQLIVHFLLQWEGNRALQRLASCVTSLPSYWGTLENPVPSVDGIGSSLFMGTASFLMIYLEIWCIILLSQSSFLSDKVLNEGI